MTQGVRTVVFWGAGATATLGMRTTDQQQKFISKLADLEESFQIVPLRRRVQEAVGDEVGERWVSALSDLLNILGDGPETKHALADISQEQLNIMRCNWDGDGGEDEFRNRIVELRTLYDWTALKAVARVCPTDGKSTQPGGKFLTDLFNILDLHRRSGHGFQNERGEFLTPQRLAGARNALEMLLQAMFYVDWQCLQGNERRKRDLRRHYDFAVALGRRMQRQGMEKAHRGCAFDSRGFYVGDIGFVSMNYDPIALWLQYVANRNLNQSAAVPHVGSPARRLKVFHDHGHVLPTRRVAPRGRDSRTPWHPMNEAAAQRLNDHSEHGSSDCIRIGRFLFPHGCLSWRECPNCGKLSSYLGNEWNIMSPSLIPPPPLREFVRGVDFRLPDDKGKKEGDSEGEREKCERGEVDARACLHCETITHTHHAPLAMQSNFKPDPPSFVDEIRRDLRVLVQNAEHIVLMGYSLPPDDVEYRAFFAARQRRNPEKPVRCSIVGLDSGQTKWLYPSELSDPGLNAIEKDASKETVRGAHQLFERDNVRFFGGGIPAVFMDGGTVTGPAVERLLDWKPV